MKKILTPEEARAEERKRQVNENQLIGKYKRIGDASMAPDKGFVKQLKKLDKEFEVIWDWGNTKWEIWRFPSNGKKPFHCATVQTQGRDYRELGADVLLKLQQGDPLRFTLNEMVAYWDEMDNQILRRKKKDLTDKIEAFCLDSWRNVHCKMIQVPASLKVRRAICDA